MKGIIRFKNLNVYCILRENLVDRIQCSESIMLISSLNLIVVKTMLHHTRLLMEVKVSKNI